VLRLGHRRILMKKLSRKLALNGTTIRVLSGLAAQGVVGGISGPKGCNFSVQACDPTFNTCPISGAPNCGTGSSCNSLACSQDC
jgi:hypothetical protein